MKNFDKAAFLDTLSETKYNREHAEEILKKLEVFLNPPKYQVLYKRLGTVKLTEDFYLDKTEFYADYSPEIYTFISLLELKVYYDEHGIKQTTKEKYLSSTEFYDRYPNYKLIRLI